MSKDDGGPEVVPLRDYFALRMELGPDGISIGLAKLLMESEPPSGSPLKNLQWWADAEAKWRYLHADSMLAARTKGRDE